MMLHDFRVWNFELKKRYTQIRNIESLIPNSN